jgi:hypothetical protein
MAGLGERLRRWRDGAIALAPAAAWPRWPTR